MKWNKQTVAAAVLLLVFLFVAVYHSDRIVPWFADGEQENDALKAKEREEIDPATLNERERKLYETIVAEAQRRRVAPVDARIDPVWKAIPGLNGLEVDVNQSFHKAVLLPEGANLPLVYREIPPQVTLEDLGPQPIYKGNPLKPSVSLMINVAWKEENIPGMLQTLREENVKATFFFLGSWLKDHMDLAKQILEEGHELSNHAYTHKDLSTLSDAQVREEIEATEALLKQLGVENRLFAPPSGDFNANTVRVAHDMGLKTILWTLDTVDWKEPPPEAILRKISARIEPGSLILMHPTVSASKALPGIIREAKRKGLALGTVSETISPSRSAPVETPPGF